MKPVATPKKGVDRCDAVSYQELLDQDSRPPPAFLREERQVDFGLAPIKASRYTSEAFFKLEVDKVFLKTWQYVCRQEDIPNPGDTHVFDLVGHSVIVVRQHDLSLKAFRNICRHRGRRLVNADGCKHMIACPFHGFTWNIDGSFKKNPMKWDFPQIDESKFGLHPVRVDGWGGLIFINFDANARPLAEVSAPMPEHFAHWNIENTYKVIHVAKVVPANWKVVVEAFVESHHLFVTHPQIATYYGDANTQYDILSDHVSRMVGLLGTPSPLIDHSAITEESITRDMNLYVESVLADGSKASSPLAPGQTARNYAAAMSRKMVEQETGVDHSKVCDSEMLDGFSYQLLPNFALWGGFSINLCYRWRPHNLNVHETLFEVIMFKKCPAGKPRPAAVPMRLLSDRENWADSPEMGYLGPVIDQDQGNLGPVQQGLRDLGEDGVIQFGKYSESRCRHLHAMIDEYIAR